MDLVVPHGSNEYLVACKGILTLEELEKLVADAKKVIQETKDKKRNQFEEEAADLLRRVREAGLWLSGHGSHFGEPRDFGKIEEITVEG